MVDPDSPTPQNTSLAQIRHLILSVDVPKCANIATGASLTNSTPALSDYISPGPPAGSPPHRWVSLHESLFGLDRH